MNMQSRDDKPADKADVSRITGGRRLRRNRRADWSRRMVREARLSANDLIWART